MCPCSRRVHYRATVVTGLCRGCATCARSCPAGALAVPAKGKVVLDRTRCDGCERCIEACMHGALLISPAPEPVMAGPVEPVAGI